MSSASEAVGARVLGSAVLVGRRGGAIEVTVPLPFSPAGIRQLCWLFKLPVTLC